MATIQVRDVPEDVHRLYRARAAAAGMSLQEYLLAEFVRNAALRSPAEVVAEVERRMSESDEGFSHEPAGPLLRTERDAR
ncbi:MAG: hypothetical protein M3Y35_15675 [Actinomycetota bacterium]|nr:hypothetical protein [Actinomycetota bacterium]